MSPYEHVENGKHFDQPPNWFFRNVSGFERRWFLERSVNEGFDRFFEYQNPN